MKRPSGWGDVLPAGLGTQWWNGLLPRKAGRGEGRLLFPELCDGRRRCRMWRQRMSCAFTQAWMNWTGYWAAVL